MERTLTGSIINTDATLTISTTTLYSGLYIYGDGIYPDTKIDTITDGTKLEMTRSAYKTNVSLSILFTEKNSNAMLELKCAHQGVQDQLKCVGRYIEFVIRGEADIVRDDYQSIKKRNTTPLYRVRAYPVIYSPSLEDLEKAGLRETESNVIIWTSKKDWLDLSVEFNTITRERMSVNFDGRDYEVIEKTKNSQFMDDYLYINFGLALR